MAIPAVTSGSLAVEPGHTVLWRGQQGIVQAVLGSMVFVLYPEEDLTKTVRFSVDSLSRKTKTCFVTSESGNPMKAASVKREEIERPRLRVIDGNKTAKVTEKPVSKKVAKDEPVSKKTTKVTEKPVSKKVAKDEPVSKKVAKDEPVSKKVAKVTEKPVSKKVAKDEPVSKKTTKVTEKPVERSKATHVSEDKRLKTLITEARKLQREVAAKTRTLNSELTASIRQLIRSSGLPFAATFKTVKGHLNPDAE